MHNRYKVNAEDFDGPVLLTGAGGCIGSWVLSLLVDAEVPVFALDLAPFNLGVDDLPRLILILGKAIADQTPAQSAAQGDR